MEIDRSLVEWMKKYIEIEEEVKSGEWGCGDVLDDLIEKDVMPLEYKLICKLLKE